MWQRLFCVRMEDIFIRKRKWLMKKYQRDSWLWFGIDILFALLAFIVFLFAVYCLPENLSEIVIGFYGTIIILYSDNSCITRKMRKMIPKRSMLYKKERKNLDKIIEYYKTMTYFCLLIRFVTPFAGWLTMGLGILFPILAIVRYFRHSDRIKFSSGDKNHLSTIATILLMPGLILLLWGIDSHKYPIHFWMIWFVISLIIIIPFFVYTKEYKKNYEVALGFCACVFLYVFGSICVINFQYDYSGPKEYKGIISDKYETSGKSRSYYLVVEHEENDLEDTFSVSVYEYREAEIGEDAIIVKRNGFLGFEWYYLQLK